MLNFSRYLYLYWYSKSFGCGTKTYKSGLTLTGVQVSGCGQLLWHSGSGDSGEWSEIAPHWVSLNSSSSWSCFLSFLTHFLFILKKISTWKSQNGDQILCSAINHRNFCLLTSSSTTGLFVINWKFSSIYSECSRDQTATHYWDVVCQNVNRGQAWLMVTLVRCGERSLSTCHHLCLWSRSLWRERRKGKTKIKTKILCK